MTKTLHLLLKNVNAFYITIAFDYLKPKNTVKQQLEDARSISFKRETNCMTQKFWC